MDTGCMILSVVLVAENIAHLSVTLIFHILIYIYIYNIGVNPVNIGNRFSSEELEDAFCDLQSFLFHSGQS